MTTVTINDIIDLLPIVADRGWRTRGDRVFRDREERCPICALANEINPESDWRGAARLSLVELGLKYKRGPISFFTNAADGFDSPSHEALRQRMARALGLRS